jgi:uncharacterized membrane protein
MADPTDHPADRPILSVRLHPHRSLSQAQFHTLLLAVGVGGVVASLPFLIMGAWPVVGFMGLDVLGVYVAFKASFRSARAYEDVKLTVLELFVAKVSARGQRAEWRFNPSWVRLQRKDHEDFGLLRVDVVSRGRALEVASFLGPDQKAAFAERLSRGLAEAKRGMRFD